MHNKCRGKHHVGQSVGRLGGRDLVGGVHSLRKTIRPQGALVLKVFRSRRHHARILRIDTQRPSSCGGLPESGPRRTFPVINQYGVIIKDQPLLADDKVRFVGEAIALVAAENEDAADEALQTIEVRFEDLPSVFDPEKALEPETASVHENGQPPQSQDRPQRRRGRRF